jgi:hypothetical protein
VATLNTGTSGLGDDLTASPDVGGLLKRLYAPWEIEQQVNLTYPLLASLFTEGSAELGGTGFHFAARMESNAGHAYIAETGTLPPGLSTVNAQAVVSPTVHAGRIDVSGLVRAMSSGNAMSFAKVVDENVSQLIESMSAYKEGVCFRTGDGALATIDTDPIAATTWDVSDTGYLREGMSIHVRTAAGTTQRAGGPYKITAVDWVAGTIDVDGPTNAAVAATDIIVLDDSQVAGTVTAVSEPIGLETAVDATGTYLGLARSDYANWAGNEYTVSGLLDEDVFLRSRTRLTQESGIQLGAMSSALRFVCHPMQADILFKLAIPRIEFTGGGAFDLGNKVEPSFGGIKLLTSYQAPPSKAWLGDFKYTQSFYAPGGKLHVDSEYNGSTLKWIADQDAATVFLKEYCAFANRRPNAFVKLQSLTEATR